MENEGLIVAEESCRNGPSTTDAVPVVVATAAVEVMHPPLLSNVEQEAADEIMCGSGSTSLSIESNVMPQLSTMLDQQRSEIMASQSASNEVDDTHDETIEVPQVGMAFKSENDAYEMYNSYALKIGFSIRKSTTRRRGDKTIYQKRIVCSNEGERGTHSSHDTVKDNATTRTSCEARVQFSVSREGIWTVQKVVLEHNHYLASSPNKRGKLRSHRHITEADKHLISQIRGAGIKPAQVYDFFKQWYGGARNVPFQRVDSNNEIGRERKKYLASSDAQTLLEYLKKKQSDDPTFFYAIQIDKDTSEIVNFFWADGQAIMDYACFGDAVSFDTTFQTNKFEMPFAPLLGTNHHKQTILFGAALLYDETIQSFVWLFETFLTAMSGKNPNTIFTDQCAAMAAAVSIVFPNTRHRLCLWHIYQNAAKHLSHVIANHPHFLAEFKRCVYEERSVAYFEETWYGLLSRYNLEENSWLQNLYDMREHWAAIFRDSFTADMTSTQRSEGMNNVFKKRFRRKLCLSELLEECDKCITSLRENEVDEDFKSRCSNPVTYIRDFPMLKTAAETYTRRLYSEFEEEFKCQFSISCKLVQHDGAIKTYRVVPMKFQDEAIVVFNAEDITISCSCRKFEFIGILCKHAHRVFNINEVFVLPTQYIMHRWTKYAKRGFICENQRRGDETLQAHAARISRKATSVALKCSVSKELLEVLEKAIDKLDLEADISLLQRPATSSVVPESSNNSAADILKGKVSIRVPQVIKGPKTKRARNALEKKGNSKKGGKKKVREDPSREDRQDSKQMFGSCDATGVGNIAIPSLAANMYGDFSIMSTPLIPGGYTNLLLGVDQEASVTRKLQFSEAPDLSIFKQ